MSDQQEDLIRVAGQWTTYADSSLLYFTLNPQFTHIGALSPTLCTFTLKAWQELVEGKCILEVPAPLFVKEINRVPSAFSAPLIRFITSPLDSIQPTGSIGINLDYNSSQETLVAKVKGRGLKEKDNTPFRLSFLGEKNGPRWEIEECMIGDLSFSGEVEKMNQGWSIEFLGLEYGNWVVCGCQGTYNQENSTIHLLSPLAAIDGGLLSHIYALPCSGFWRGKAESLITLDAHHKLKSISAKGSGQLERCSIGQFELLGDEPLSFELVNGEILKIPHWEGICTLNTSHPFTFDNLSYHLKTGKLVVEHVLGQCDPQWMKPLSNLLKDPFKEYLSYIEGENPISFEWKSSLLKHDFSCSELPLKSMSLKNLRGSIDPTGYDIDGVLESRIEPCLFHLTPEGLHLKTVGGESIGKLQFLFDTHCVCHSISGNGKGFTLLLENQENRWTGSLHCDLGKLLPLFSNTSFPVQGGEFVIEGGINENSFEGALRVNRAAFFQGYFDHIDALINYHNNEWTITNLHLFDPHLHLVAPEIICKKVNHVWEIFSKKVTGTNLFPMQLQQMFLGDLGKPHPLKIESFTLRDLNSCYPFNRWTGSGSLQFCHLFPLDETPKLTIPQEQLSTILSVDPKWLLPSSGEVEFTLSQDSILVERFKEFYSEGKGIRFELTSDDKPARIFWDGTWHLPLKLKPHNLPMKWVEMVTLTLTGNFQDPQLHWSARK